MNRGEFLRLAGILGLGSTLAPSLLTSCAEDIHFPDFEVNFNGKVLIVGAGSAGLIAGHILNQYGIDFEILEASSRFGGRVMKQAGFADFPIDMGAEWIHTDPSIFATLLNDPESTATIDLINFAPKTFQLWKKGKLRDRNFISNFYAEFKFKNSTWHDFFDQFIVPDIEDRIKYQAPVVSIDYQTDKVEVKEENETLHEADKVIVTVPLTQLKNSSIAFNPALSDFKTEALSKVEMPDGIKQFFEFSDRFYPDIVLEGSLLDAATTGGGDKVIYDAAFGKDTSQHILGIFSVGEPAAIYAQHPTEEELLNYSLNELDTIFDGQATRHFIKFTSQNWSRERYIEGSYSYYQDYDALNILSEPIDNKVFFAGEAYSLEDQATVHGAGLTAYREVEKILKG